MAIFIIGLTIFLFCVLWLPKLAGDAAVMNPEFAYLKFPVLIGIYITAIPFYLALYQALRILNYIKGGEAFSEFPLISLGRIKNCATAIIILYVIGMVLLAGQNALHPGIAILGIVIIFATTVVAVFAVILQELLKSAIDIKIENDLTV